MTTELRNRRLQAVKLADAINTIEGIPVSSYAKTLSKMCNGKLTSEQMKDALFPYHCRLANTEKRI